MGSGLLGPFRKHPEEQARMPNILSEIKRGKSIVAKSERIVDGKNANIPVDMSDHFYDHGNEYCRYLITDPRSDRAGKEENPLKTCLNKH